MDTPQARRTAHLQLQARLMAHLHSQPQAHLMAPQATDPASLDRLLSVDRPMDLLDSPAVSQHQQSQPHPAHMVPQASLTTPQPHDQAALMALQAVPRAHTVPQAAHPAATEFPIKRNFHKKPSLDTKKTLIKLYS